VHREQRRQFVRDHRICVFGYGRKNHAPPVVSRDRQLAVGVLTSILGVMAGEPVPDSRRPQIEQMVDDEQPVAIRAGPFATCETRPGHVRQMIVHQPGTRQTGTSMPW